MILARQCAAARRRTRTDGSPATSSAAHTEQVLDRDGAGRRRSGYRCLRCHLVRGGDGDQRLWNVAQGSEFPVVCGDVCGRGYCCGKCSAVEHASTGRRRGIRRAVPDGGDDGDLRELRPESHGGSTTQRNERVGHCSAVRERCGQERRSVPELGGPNRSPRVRHHREPSQSEHGFGVHVSAGWNSLAAGGSGAARSGVAVGDPADGPAGKSQSVVRRGNAGPRGYRTRRSGPERCRRRPARRPRGGPAVPGHAKLWQGGDVHLNGCCQPDVREPERHRRRPFLDHVGLFQRRAVRHLSGGQEPGFVFQRRGYLR